MIKRWGWYAAGATGGLMMFMCVLLGDMNGHLYQGAAAGAVALLLGYFLWLQVDDSLIEATERIKNEKKD